MSFSKTRVAVLRGGPSSEYDVSLKTGASVLQHLPDKYHGIDVFIDKSGIWHVGGVALAVDKVLHQCDVVWNALHGAYGEDGQVQHILQTYGIPFTGSRSFASSIAMNKISSKDMFRQAGLKTPQHLTVTSTDDLSAEAAAIFKTFLMPAVIKPATAGSSVGVSIAHTPEEVLKGLESALQHSRTAMVEEYIRGKEATCGVIEDFRGQPLYALMPVEIRPKSGNFFDYEAKYVSGMSDELCPGNFTLKEKQIIEDFARRAHIALGLEHYSRSDMIVTPKRGIYILETNTLPGLTRESLLPKALEAGGTSIPIFIDHILQLAMR
jgi:D-alanine-D-alanine ligase